MTTEIRSRLKTLRRGDRLLAQNLKAVLVVILKLAGEGMFANFYQDE